jgi:hypothetical protein
MPCKTKRPRVDCRGPRWQHSVQANPCTRTERSNPFVCRARIDLWPILWTTRVALSPATASAFCRSARWQWSMGRMVPMNMTRRTESVRSHCGLNSKDSRYPCLGTSGCKAIHEMVYVDDRGEQLNCGRMYRLHLERTPSVDAYWSLTTYDTPNYFLVDNPMDRCSIGGRSAGLVYNQDGSLDNHIQHDSSGRRRRPTGCLPRQPTPFRSCVCPSHMQTCWTANIRFRRSTASADPVTLTGRLLGART